MKQDILDNAAKGVTIITGIVAIVTLLYVNDTLESTKTQLDYSIQTSQDLQKMIEASNNQTKALEDALKEISYSTDVLAYVQGGGYNLGLYRCGSLGQFVDDNGSEQYRLLYSPVILDRDGDPTPIPFYIYLKFNFWDEYHHTSTGRDILGTQRVGQYLWEPSERPSLYLNLTEAITKANDKGIDKITILLQDHSFAPYSSSKDDLLAEYFDGENHLIFTELRLLDEEWDNNPIEDSMCANALGIG